jgi:transposase, IS6 family
MPQPARALFTRECLYHAAPPVEVTTDRAPVYPRVLEHFVPGARPVLDRYANNAIEADHPRLKGSATSDARSEADPIGAHHRGRARVRANLRRGHYELTVDQAPRDRLPAAFADLAHCL